MRQRILEELTEFYQAAAGKPEAPFLDHLSNDLTRTSYIQKAEDMAKVLAPHAKILDWGSGFGQMAFVLQRMGFNPTAYDVIRRDYSLLPLAGLELVYGQDEVKLPFEDNSFEAVVGCGVLEHVPNILGSLQELNRIIKPSGHLFIYNLPYIFSPSEAYAAQRGISVHPIKFTKLGTKQLLELADFQVKHIAHENGIPKRFAGPLQSLRGLTDQATGLLLKLDEVIVRIPFLRSVISNSIKAVAIKPTAESRAGQAKLTRLWWD